jgi:hypothetical protein
MRRRRSRRRERSTAPRHIANFDKSPQSPQDLLTTESLPDLLAQGSTWLAGVKTDDDRGLGTIALMFYKT